MSKVYECHSEITKGEYRRLIWNKWRVIRLLCFWSVISVAVLNGAGEINEFVLMILGVMSVMFFVGYDRSLMKSYHEDQDVIFSEDGIRNKEEAIFNHWVHLADAVQKQEWVLTKYGNSYFIINANNLSQEAEHFLMKRLRGIRR